MISGAMGGKVQAGQLEESAYLLEAGQRLESWKRGKEMHFRQAILDRKKMGKKNGSGGRGGIAQVLDLTRIPDSHLYSLV